MEKSISFKFVFLFALLIFCISMSFLNNVPDFDLWARLIVGQHFFEAGLLPRYDFLSYTPTHFWYDHEWGSSLIFYSVYKYLGESGLVVAKGFLIFGIIFFILKTIEIRKPKFTHAYNIIFFIAVFLALFPVLSTTIRCHLFSFLFFTIWLYLLEKVRLGQKKWVYYLPFMMIFWSNIHGGCVSGIGLLLIYAVGEFLNKKPYRDYLVSMIFSSLAMFINPYGPKYVAFLIKATTMDRPLITEWMGSFSKLYLYKYMRFKIFGLIMALTSLIKVIKEGFDYKKADKTKIILLIITAILAIKHIKHQPFFVITAAAFLYDDFYNIFNDMMAKIRSFLKIKSEKFVKYFVYTKETLVYLLLLLASCSTLVFTDPTMKMSNKFYPIYAVEFVHLNNLKGNLFVNFHYGSYVAYKLYPDNLIVMDGRYEEVYYDELIEQMKKFHLVKTDSWNDIIEKYHTDVIIIEKKYPVYKKLLQEGKWAQVFEDQAFAVFVPVSDLKTKYILPTNDYKYYDETKFDTKIKFELDKNSFWEKLMN